MERRVPGRQGRLLIAYLAVNQDRLVTRDELSFALWGDELPPDAESGLNALVSKLRAVFGKSRVVGRSELRFVADNDTFVDVHGAIDALHVAESHVAAGRWHDGWQPGTPRITSLGASSWSGTTPRGSTSGVTASARWRRARSSATPAASWRWATPSPPSGVARVLVERAPFRESAYALLMDATAKRGNVAEALRVYEELRRLLDDELGVAPGPDVTRLRDCLLDVPSRA